MDEYFAEQEEACINRPDPVDRLLKKLMRKNDAVRGSWEDAAAINTPPRHESVRHDSTAPRVQRLAQQLSSIKEILRSSGAPSHATSRISGLESKVYQLETDAVAAVAARRKAEHELANAKVQLQACQKSASLKSADLEQSLEFFRAQLEARAQEAARAERKCHMLELELQQAREERHQHEEQTTAVQRRLRERLAASERCAQEARDNLRATDSRVLALEAARRAAEDSQNGMDEECARLAEVSRCDAAALQEELAAAREQLEAAVKRDLGGKEVEEALRDALSQSAMLAQECRGLRVEVGRLQGTLLEEKAAREQLKQRAELKLMAGGHEATALRSKLQAKTDEAKAATALVASVQADSERRAEAQEATIAALREKVAEGRRRVEEARRRTASDLQVAEARFEERTAAAVEVAVERHQRRIQDLELQLAHAARPGQVEAANSSIGVPRGYIASLLDYIPRSEHLRLLEARAAARDAEAQAAVEATRAAVVRESQVRIDAMERELLQAREQARAAAATVSEHKERAASAEHASGIHKLKFDEYAKDLERCQGEVRDLKLQLAGAKREMEEQRKRTDAATTAAAEGLAAEVQRGRDVAFALEASLVAQKGAAEEVKALKQQRAEADVAAEKSRQRLEECGSEVERLKFKLVQAEAEVEESADRTRAMEQRCAAAEDEGRGHLSRLGELAEEMEQAKLAAATTAEAHLRRADKLAADLERLMAAAAAVSKDAARGRQADLLALLSRVEATLGVLNSAASYDESQDLALRTDTVLSRCRQVRAEATANSLAAERAQQELILLQVRQAAAERQYISDMAALEQTAREHVRGVKSQAEEAIAGLRRASTMLQGRISGQVSRDGSLASEVEGLKAQLAQQAQQAAAVEQKELAFASMLSELTQNLQARGFGGSGAEGGSAAIDDEGHFPPEREAAQRQNA